MMMMQKPNLNDLKVGDIVYTHKWHYCFKYDLLVSEVITRITPKRTKIVTDKDEYTNLNIYNPFIIPDEVAIQRGKVAEAFKNVMDFSNKVYKQKFRKYSDEELLELSELIKPVMSFMKEHELKGE